MKPRRASKEDIEHLFGKPQKGNTKTMKAHYKGHPDQRWGHISYAQHGDDFMLLNLFELIGVERPSYLDIGAHHPETISNTKLLYDRGSRGVNVDANQELIEIFNRERPEDRNIRVAVGPEAKADGAFYKFSGTSGRNTLNKLEAELFSEHFPIREVETVPVITINQLVNTYLGGEYPDLLSMDIEGDDLQVIKDASFIASRPKVICMEVRPTAGSVTRRVLQEKGFMCYCRMGENLFFVHREFESRVY